jgi:hypothetical protein
MMNESSGSGTRMRCLMRRAAQMVALVGAVVLLIGSASAAHASAATQSVSSHTTATTAQAAVPQSEPPACGPNRDGYLWYDYDNGVIYICAFLGIWEWVFYGYIPPVCRIPQTIATKHDAVTCL